jgi:hypothetical protein
VLNGILSNLSQLLAANTLPMSLMGQPRRLSDLNMSALPPTPDTGPRRNQPTLGPQGDIANWPFDLKMGADDFIRKPFSQRLLVERVKTVLRRVSPKNSVAPTDASKEIFERGPLRMDPERHACVGRTHR